MSFEKLVCLVAAQIFAAGMENIGQGLGMQVHISAEQAAEKALELMSECYKQAAEFAKKVQEG